MRKAVCVGINYTGTLHALRGCVNDANDWATLLAKHGFTPDLYLDGRATRANLLTTLTGLVDGTLPGETSFFSFSGHGSWIPDKDGDEPDGRDECLCPYDTGVDGQNLIIDDELHLIFNRIQPGAVVVFVTDSCHSGTVYRMLGPVGGSGDRRVRFLPPSHYVADYELRRRMDRAYGQSATRAEPPLPGLVHFSACRDNEYAADTAVDGRPCGAFSSVALPAFAAALAAAGTYQAVWQQVRDRLPSWEYQQTPLLNALPELRQRRVFL